MTCIYDRKTLIVSENLAVFESVSGDVCDDVIFSSGVGEALLKRAREIYRYNLIDDRHVIIYR